MVVEVALIVDVDVVRLDVNFVVADVVVVTSINDLKIDESHEEKQFGPLLELLWACLTDHQVPFC